MDPINYVMLISIGVCMSLLMLSKLTHAARRRARQTPPQRDVKQTKAPKAIGESIQPFPFSITNIPQEHKAEYWWFRLLSGAAVLGAILVPFQLIVFLVNSYVLAMRLEMLFGRGGDPLFTLNVLGWEREINIFDIVGLLISAIQVIAAAAFINLKDSKSWPKYAALFAWVLMATLEVGVSVYGGLAAGGNIVIALLNGALALGLALADSLFGLYIIEHLILPLTLCIAYTLALPIRLLVKFVRLKATKYRLGPQAPRPTASPARTSRVTSVLAAIDTVFDPLRNLDAFVLGLLRRLRFTRKPTQITKGELVCTTNSKYQCCLPSC